MPDERSNLSLSADDQRFIANRVASGEYHSAGEVVHEALKLLQQREATLNDLREKVQAGLNQAERGELRNGHHVFDELRRQLENQQRDD